MPISELSSVSAECLERAKLEAERRYCGNKSEELTGKDVVATSQEKLSMLLDPRTCNALGKFGVDKAEFNENKKMLCDEYVKYGKNVRAFRKAKVISLEVTEDESLKLKIQRRVKNRRKS